MDIFLSCLFWSPFIVKQNLSYPGLLVLIVFGPVIIGFLLITNHHSLNERFTSIIFFLLVLTLTGLFKLYVPKK